MRSEEQFGYDQGHRLKARRSTTSYYARCAQATLAGLLACMPAPYLRGGLAGLLRGLAHATVRQQLLH